LSIYFSVLNRKSGSPDLGGHYWSYIRDHKSGAWFKFNDVAVNRVEQVDVRFLKHLVWWCFSCCLQEMYRQSFGEIGGNTSA